MACPGELRRRDRGGFAGFSVPVPSCALASGTTVSLTAGVETQVDFALARGGRASGLVTGSGAGGLGGTRVEVFGVTGEWPGAAEADVNGFYLTPAYPAGSYFLRTVNYGGWTDELYDDLPCTGCDPTTGTPVPVAAGGVSGRHPLRPVPRPTVEPVDRLRGGGRGAVGDRGRHVHRHPEPADRAGGDRGLRELRRHRDRWCGLHGRVRQSELRSSRDDEDRHRADPRRPRRGAGRDVPGDAVVPDERGDRHRTGDRDHPQRRRRDGSPAHGGPYRDREWRCGLDAFGHRLRSGLHGAVPVGHAGDAHRDPGSRLDGRGLVRERAPVWVSRAT